VAVAANYCERPKQRARTPTCLAIAASTTSTTSYKALVVRKERSQTTTH